MADPTTYPERKLEAAFKQLLIDNDIGPGETTDINIFTTFEQAQLILPAVIIMCPLSIPSEDLDFAEPIIGNWDITLEVEVQSHVKDDDLTSHTVYEAQVRDVLMCDDLPGALNGLTTGKPVDFKVHRHDLGQFESGVGEEDHTMISKQTSIVQVSSEAS